MSLSCLLGMHDIIWNSNGSKNFRSKHAEGLQLLSSMSAARIVSNPTQIIPNSSTGFSNGIGGKVATSTPSSLGYLFESNGVGPNFRNDSGQETFRTSQQWSVGENSTPQEVSTTFLMFRVWSLF